MVVIILQNGKDYVLKPSDTGEYFVRSAETSGEWIPVVIKRKNGILYVNDPYIDGLAPLNSYHNGLVDVEWKRQEG